MQISALIPAYNPSEELIELVHELSNSSFNAIIVVDDGSVRECEKVFLAISMFPRVTILRHAVNLGKGAAIKTGLNFSYCAFPDNIGVITLDADGQHLVDDVLIVSQALLDNPQALIMGARKFDRDVPFRSMIGNNITKHLFRFLVGHKLGDTQSGLRGIPQDFIPILLKIDSRGYEFELDMLLACKYTARLVIEREINTVYMEGNKSSHFNPLLDSMRVYFVLFRFTFTSLMSAIIDYAIFIIVYNADGGLVMSQISARLLSMLFNYAAVKRIVFYSDQQHSHAFPKYLMLVLVSGSLSLILIDLMTEYAGVNVITAKIIAESLVFLANFAIQRDFIFTKKEFTPPGVTN